jgi:hypothetical protein
MTPYKRHFTGTALGIGAVVLEKCALRSNDVVVFLPTKEALAFQEAFHCERTSEREV